ncbi:TorD/DmsD family molecular chaperone [Ferrimonas lipolytica]|uniref:Cytoplasmic chaperone TorD family protein n=1 Tax=Ferrimonas lipolytica TaxID=2724191 RepID=A0A6H1UG22_9GAMM|nr:molecular chaperone TorD family protein [Ferrimonas lipolytica]QIZ78031.1 cytoplasmic chaperone TorD family protein [Ferrimonas lipolytica]
MNEIELLPLAAATSGVLHNLYFAKPTEAFVNQFSDGELLQSWPQFGDEQAHRLAIKLITDSIVNDSAYEIERDYYQLFVGPGAMTAYPWGSVYTDKENLLFGATAVAFKEFCQRYGIELTLDHHQPLDHIGLVVGVLGSLLQNEQLQATDELLVEHLMPWAPRLLECVNGNAKTGFYRGFAMLTEQMLARLMAARELNPKELTLYK